MKVTQYISADFSIDIPDNIDESTRAEYLLDIVNKLNPSSTYIIFDYSDDYITLVDLECPSKQITFTKQ